VLDKLKQSHKIDLIVALSMAALAAVRGQSENSWGQWVGNGDLTGLRSLWGMPMVLGP
jgi:hypothetical protein